jgi:hypothetical protein
LPKRRYVAPYYIAVVDLALGERDDAFHWLEKSFEERSAYMTNLMPDPTLDTLPRIPDSET